MKNTRLLFFFFFRITAQFLLVSAKVQQKLKGIYHQQSHEGALQEPHQHVAPVVLIIRHPGQACVNGGGDQEELDCGSEQPSPVGPQASLQVELRTTNGGLVSTESIRSKTEVYAGARSSACIHLHQRQ